MPNSRYDTLPVRFHDGQQRLAALWHSREKKHTGEKDPRVDGLQGEALHRLGNAHWCLWRLQLIERSEHEGVSTDSSGYLGQEMWVISEAFYYSAHSFLKLCEKVPELGLNGLYESLRASDIIIVRNWLIEHVEHPKAGVVGATFGWGDHGLGPELKPFATVGQLPKVRGLYVHAAQLIEKLEQELCRLAI